MTASAQRLLVLPLLFTLSVNRAAGALDPDATATPSHLRFDDSRVLLVASGIVVVGPLLLIALLLLQRRERRRTEHTVKAREDSLRRSAERIRQLAGRLIHAQEAARAEIARDLHDDICQQLTAVSLAVAALRKSSGRIEDSATQRAFRELEYQMQVAFDGIRRLSHDLHPTSLQLLGLAPALRTHCLDIAERHGVRVAFSAAGDFRTLVVDTGICLYRIAQEALRNAVHHGRAARISVTINRYDTTVELVVTDDGQGFDVAGTRSGSSGLGLVSMEERARVVGGAVTVVSGRGRGTTVRVVCPCQAAGATVADVS